MTHPGDSVSRAASAPAAYGTAAKSPIKVTVKEGANELNIDLKAR